MAPAFRSRAGPRRGLWLATLIVLLGHAVSSAGLVALAALCWRRRRIPPRAALWSLGYHLLLALPALALWWSA